MNAFWKEFVRTITRSLGRFLALLAIVALGAGFYAGLRMTAPDMKAALDSYLDATNSYDVRVVSTMGLEEADLQALRELPDIEYVMGGYQADVLALWNDKSYTTRVHSYPASAPLSVSQGDDTVMSDDPSYLNRLILTEGRWPQQEGECLISADRVLGRDVQVGDTFRFEEGTSELGDTFVSRSYTVVGKVHTPYYVSSAAIDASSLGSGVVQQLLYVPEDAFVDSFPYTDAFATVHGARVVANATAEYDQIIAQAKDEIAGIADERCQARLESLTSSMYENATTFTGLLDLVEYRLSHTREEIENPETPEWLIMGRDKNVGMASFSSDADRVDHIASVFPFIFFLVAALVALTTMTRLVDEERQLIGTYKALGYARSRITSKYVGYVLLAGGIGSVLGIAILARVLPGVIMNAYAIMYYVPATSFPIDWGIALLSSGLAIGVTLVATWASVASTLREKPASLMLPRAPKAGKRILLERIRPLWQRTSFTWKVTFRNLFRYKKRLIMTVIGIAGCTALLLTGLGLHDAINDIIDLQYGEIIKHNAVISIEDDADENDVSALQDVIERSGCVESSTRAYIKTMLASGPRANDKRIDIVVPEDPVAFAQMKEIRTRTTHEPVTFVPGQALLNEKLAQELGLTVGDTIHVAHQDAMGNATNEVFEVTIGGLYENYIYNYLYLDEDTYEQVFGERAPMNSRYVNVVTDEMSRENLDNMLHAIPSVKTIAYNDEVIDTYRTMLRSVDLIVVVLVVSAALLAFIVLYNLTNINIEERIREIATLKVLGFTRGETNAYIFREIALLSLIGALVGLVLGIYLEGFVVTTAEVDQVMFGRAVHPPSFIAAFVLTLVFSGLSMLIMRPKLARVDMVESLKSIE